MTVIYQKQFTNKAKFQMPKPPAGLSDRIRLFCKMDRFSEYRIMLITAPAGYGKTTLLAMWVNHIMDWSCEKNFPVIGWLNLDEGDNEEETFFDYLFQAFYEHPLVPSQLKEAANKQLGGCTSLKQQHIIYFINDLAKLENQILLILDNFHMVSNEKLLCYLKYFLEYLPSNVHIILSGRTMPQMELAKWRLYGKILDISEEELAFTYEEAEYYYRSTSQANYSPKQTQAIYSLSEGWPAALQLMLFSKKQNERNIPGLVYSLDGKTQLSQEKNQLLYDYLMEEVFQSLEAAYHKFLIHTSQPEQFSPSLSNYLLDIPDSSVYLEELKKNKIFLYCIDEYGQQYRYHKIFREFLLKQFYQLDKALQASLCQKLVSWYEQENLWNEAITYAMKGEQYEKAVALIEKISGFYGWRGEPCVLDKWNRRLPREYRENNPRLLLNSAWAASAGGRIELIPVYLKKLNQLSLSSDMKCEITALVSSGVSPFDRNLDAVIKECIGCLSSLPEEALLNQLLCLHIGICYLYQGNLTESLLFFEKCRQASLESGSAYLNIVSAYAIIRYQVQIGRLKEAVKETRALLEQIEETETVILPVKGLIYAILAEIFLLQSNRQEALSMAEKGLELGRFGADYWTMGENLLVLVKIYYAKKQQSHVEAAIKELESCIRGRDFFDLEMKYQLFLAEKQIEEGRLESARCFLFRKEYAANEKFLSLYPKYNQLKKRLDTVKPCQNISLPVRLSTREQEILQLISLGDTNAEIADKLFISVNTVKTHLLSIFDKLNVHSRAKAAAYAKQMFLL